MADYVVPKKGLEPPQCCHRQDLNLVRLVANTVALWTSSVWLGDRLGRLGRFHNGDRRLAMTNCCACDNGRMFP